MLPKYIGLLKHTAISESSDNGYITNQIGRHKTKITYSKKHYENHVDNKNKYTNKLINLYSVQEIRQIIYINFHFVHIL